MNIITVFSTIYRIILSCIVIFTFFNILGIGELMNNYIDENIPNKFDPNDPVIKLQKAMYNKYSALLKFIRTSLLTLFPKLPLFSIPGYTENKGPLYNCFKFNNTNKSLAYSPKTNTILLMEDMCGEQNNTKWLINIVSYNKVCIKSFHNKYLTYNPNKKLFEIDSVCSTNSHFIREKISTNSFKLKTLSGIYIGLYHNNLTPITPELVTREANRRIVYFKSYHNGYLRHNKSNNMVDYGSATNIWEQWEIISQPNTNWICVKSYHGKYLADARGRLTTEGHCGDWAKWLLINKNNKYCIKSVHGNYIRHNTHVNKLDLVKWCQEWEYWEIITAKNLTVINTIFNTTVENRFSRNKISNINNVPHIPTPDLNGISCKPNVGIPYPDPAGCAKAVGKAVSRAFSGWGGSNNKKIKGGECLKYYTPDIDICDKGLKPPLKIVLNEIFKIINNIIIDKLINGVLITFLNKMKNIIINIIFTFIYNLVSLINAPLNIYNLITQDIIQLSFILLEVLGGNPFYLVLMILMPGIIFMYFQFNFLLATVKIPFIVIQNFFKQFNYNIENTYNLEYISLAHVIHIVYFVFGLIYFGCFYAFLILIF